MSYYILQETGDALLQENGDYLLLEQGVVTERDAEIHGFLTDSAERDAMVKVVWF